MVLCYFVEFGASLNILGPRLVERTPMKGVTGIIDGKNFIAIDDAIPSDGNGTGCAEFEVFVKQVLHDPYAK